ncbi:MAG: hypothetical protein WA885_14175 [Phormidesmis sp.]
MSDSTSVNSAAATGEAVSEQPKQSLLKTTLSGAMALARENNNYAQANEQFEAVVNQIESDPSEAATLLKQIWKEYISVQRSANFYESLSSAEADLSQKMAKSNVQLKQNYMRLIQEQ